jgi:hypothetical protein
MDGERASELAQIADAIAATGVEVALPVTARP